VPLEGYFTFFYGYDFQKWNLIFNQKHNLARKHTSGEMFRAKPKTKEERIMKEKEFPVFSYQLKTELEQLTALVEKLPGIIPDEVRQNAEAAFSDLTQQIEKSKKYLEAYQTELTGFQQKACDLYDDAYKTIREKKKSTDERMEKLADLKEIKCRIPYHFTELIDMAERLSNLTEDQFERLIALAKAFAGGDK
jgi:hypothetical protein